MKKATLPALALLAVLGATALSALAQDGAPSMEDLKQAYQRPQEVPYPAENPYSKEQHVATAVAINVDHLVAWLDGHPLAITRTSRFAALRPKAA